MLARIGKLYEIEGGLRGQPPDVRQAVRQLRSRPLVEDLHLWLQDHLPRVPGWTDLAKASEPGASSPLTFPPIGRLPSAVSAAGSHQLCPSKPLVSSQALPTTSWVLPSSIGTCRGIYSTAFPARLAPSEKPALPWPARL